MIETKTRLLAILGALGLLLLVVELVRRRKLKEEYSILWVAASLVLLVMAAWYQLLGWITDVIGGVALSTTLFFFGLLFVFFMLLHFSVRISAQERRLTALVQEVGLFGVRPVPLLAGGSDPPAARIAVVIPCYNDGELLLEAIESVHESELIEVVVVDDASTDQRTIEVLADLERSGTRVVRRDVNGGLGAARNTGFEATSAEYVYPLDADDRLAPGALAAMADTLDRSMDAAFTWGDYMLFGERSGYYRSPTNWLPWTLTYVNPYPVCSMFRRSVLRQLGGWHGRAYEDWDLWLRLVGASLSGVRTNRVVYHRRLHGDARLLQQARQRHQLLYREIQQRNADVFGRREELRRDEHPAHWKRLVYPVLFGSRAIVPLQLERMLQRTMMRLGAGLP